MIELTIKFDNKDQLDGFVAWLSNSGEQDYWQSIEDSGHLDDHPEGMADFFLYEKTKKEIIATSDDKVREDYQIRNFGKIIWP